MTGPALDAQIAAVKTALAFASSAVERACLKAAVATLEKVKASEREANAATKAVAEAVGRIAR